MARVKAVETNEESGIRTFTIVGARPIIFHSLQAADPFSNEFTRLKELRAQAKKTGSKEDLMALAYMEWKTALYLNSEGKIIIPADNIERAIQEGAASLKLGKDIKSNVELVEDAILEHDGPEDLEELFRASRRYRYYKAVTISRAKIYTTRPIFPDWKATFQVELTQDKKLNWKTIVEIMIEAGRKKGLCERRPKYGKFNVVE